MIFWSGAGSCYFHHWPSRRQQKTKFCQKIFFRFSAYYYLKVHLHNFSKIKSQKKSRNSRNQYFSYYFCLMIEGPGSKSGSVLLTNWSGCRRPKNMDPTDPNPQHCILIGVLPSFFGFSLFKILTLNLLPRHKWRLVSGSGYGSRSGIQKGLNGTQEWK